jgi:hypothetical protein
MRILLTLITIVCLTGVSWGQQNNKPNVWVIDDTPSNFGDFYNPFMKTLKTLRIGSRLREVQTFDEPSAKHKPADVWVLISSQPLERGGFVWNVMYGLYDSCRNNAYTGSTYGVWTLGGNGKVEGYEMGVKIVEWISGQYGFGE